MQEACRQMVEIIAAQMRVVSRNVLGIDSVGSIAQKTKKMPAASNKEAQVWKGFSEDLEKCRTWFEGAAAEAGIDKVDSHAIQSTERFGRSRPRDE